MESSRQAKTVEEANRSVGILSQDNGQQPGSTRRDNAQQDGSARKDNGEQAGSSPRLNIDDEINVSLLPSVSSNRLHGQQMSSSGKEKNQTDFSQGVDGQRYNCDNYTNEGQIETEEVRNMNEYNRNSTTNSAGAIGSPAIYLERGSEFYEIGSSYQIRDISRETTRVKERKDISCQTINVWETKNISCQTSVAGYMKDIACQATNVSEMKNVVSQTTSVGILMDGACQTKVSNISCQTKSVLEVKNVSCQTISVSEGMNISSQNVFAEETNKISPALATEVATINIEDPSLLIGSVHENKFNKVRSRRSCSLPSVSLLQDDDTDPADTENHGKQKNKFKRASDVNSSLKSNKRKRNTSAAVHNDVDDTQEPSDFHEDISTTDLSLVLHNPNSNSSDIQSPHPWYEAAPVDCPDCGEIILRSQFYKKHIREHGYPSKSAYVNKHSELPKVSRAKADSWICLVCDDSEESRVMWTKGSILSHLKGHNMSLDEYEKVFMRVKVEEEVEASVLEAQEVSVREEGVVFEAQESEGIEEEDYM